MQKLHVTAVALLLAAAAVAGAVAVAHTTKLGSAARQSSDVAYAARVRQLSTFAAKLRKELHAKPPALPTVPKAQPVAAAAASSPRIVYHQPPPVVVTVHHHGDDGSREADGRGGGDD